MNRLFASAAFAFLFLSIACDHVSAAPLRGVEVRVKTASGQTKELSLYSECYALVIGCSGYFAGWPILPNPIKDALDVTAVLKHKGWTVTTLLNPDGENLKREFNRLVTGPGQESSNAILVWFSGHGYTTKQADGTKLGYLVPVDAPDPAKDLIGFMESSFSMRQVETVSMSIFAKHVLMVFDSCFSGAIFQMVRAKPSAFIEEKVSYPVRQFITAGSDQEQVPDRSVFKEVFLQGINDGFADLNKDSYVTGEELGSYLQERVVNYSRKAQHPQFGKINNPKLDKGDFVFKLAPFEDDLKRSDELSIQAFISVDANVSDAEVFLDGKMIGRTPVEKTKLNPGDYTLTVKKEGHEVYQKQLKFDAGRIRNIFAVLTSSDALTARLYVDTKPPDAKVKILNIAPKFYQGICLKPGRYHLEVADDDFQTERVWVELKGGEDKSLDIHLREQRENRTEHVPSSTNLNTWQDPHTGMKFVWVPGGCFQMGCASKSNECSSSENPVHEVCVDGFWMGRYEVTVGQFRQFFSATKYVTDAQRNKNGCWSLVDKEGFRLWDWNLKASWRWPGFDQTENMPVTCISWKDVQVFLDWLNRNSENSFRLPTEAEWEYAARAGAQGLRFWGNDPDMACNYANVADRSQDGKWKWDNGHACMDGYYYSSPVGTFKPNKFGLYDMLGNVWELCEDHYKWDAYTKHAHQNPKYTEDVDSYSLKAHNHVIRGGGLNSPPTDVRSARRYSSSLSPAPGYTGFRIVRQP